MQKVIETQKELLEKLQQEISDNNDFIEKIEFIKQLSFHDFQEEQSGLSLYKITTKTGVKEVYGFFSSDKKSKRFYNKKIILQKLNEYNFPTDELSITKIIKFYPKTNIFLREGAEGNSLLEILEENNNNYKKATIGAARWIARMHNLTPEKNIFQSRYKIAKKNYKNYLKDIKNYLPEKEAISKNILSKVSKISKKPETSLIHGDFQAQNIIYNQIDNKTIVIDYDWAGMGDYLYDIASFLIQLDYKTSKILDAKETIALKNIFLREYEKASGQILNGTAKEINAYQAEIAIQRINWIIGFIKKPIGIELNEVEQKITIKNLFKKAEECIDEDKNINLKLYPYSTL